MRMIKKIAAAAMALTMGFTAAGMTAYASDDETAREQQSAVSDSNDGKTINGEFESGSSYSVTKNGTLRIHGSYFTPEDFYTLVMMYTPKHLWITGQVDIEGDEEQVNEWFKTVTGGGCSIEAVCLMKRGENSFLDKYNKMIEGLLNDAQAKGENVTVTDLKMKYKLFTFDQNTRVFEYPDGSVCENCGYISILDMKDYPNNKELIAAEFSVNGTPTVRGDVNGDKLVNVRDCAHIANCLSRQEGYELPDSADYNNDGKINIRDAAAISKDLAKA